MNDSYRHTAPYRVAFTQVMHSTSRHAAALRALQKQSAAADARDSAETHRELYELCNEYLTGAETVLHSVAALLCGPDRSACARCKGIIC